MRWAVWRCFRGASRSAISHSSISSRYEPSFGAGRRSGRLRGGGSGEASAWRTARRWTPWRSARALIDRLSRSRSLLICSNVSTRDPIPVCRLPLELHEARTVGGESDGVGPFQGSAVGPSESSVPNRVPTRLRRLLRQSRRTQRLAVIEKGEDTRHLAVAKIDQKPNVRIDRHAAATSASLRPTGHEHPAAKIAPLFREQAQFRPGLAYVREVRFDALVSPIATGLDRSVHRREQFEVGRCECNVGIEVAPVVGVYPPLDDLHVLLRQRLPQAHGLEDIIAVGVVLDANDQAVSEPVDREHLRSNRDSTRARVAAELDSHAHRVAIVMEADLVDRQVCPRLAEPLEKAAVLIKTPALCALGPFPDWAVDEIWREELGVTVVLGRLSAVKCAPHDLYVRL